MVLKSKQTWLDLRPKPKANDNKVATGQAYFLNNVHKQILQAIIKQAKVIKSNDISVIV